jgi:hypothetical protein
MNERRILKVAEAHRVNIHKALLNATSYDEWAQAALELDIHEGKFDSVDSFSSTLGREAWKDDPRSTDYNYELVRKRLNELHEARIAGDLGKVLFLLRTSLSRTFADTGNPEVLYPPSYFLV